VTHRGNGRMADKEPTREERRNYNIVVLAMVSMSVTTSTIYMVLPIFFSIHGVSRSGNGVLIAIGTFAGIISSIIAGRYSDSHGRKPVLFTGVALYALVFFLFALFGRDFNTFLILRFIEGFAYYMTPVAITTIAADIFPQRERGRAMALYTVSGGVGQMIGPLIAGLFTEVANFNSYFVFCGSFVAVSAAIILFFVNETLPEELKVKPRTRARRRVNIHGFYSSLKGLGAVVGIFLTAILIYRTGNTMVNPFFSLYLREVLHMNMTQMSFFFSVRALCTLVFAPIAGRLSDRYGRKPLFLFGIATLTGTMMGYRQVRTHGHVLIIRALESTSNAILQPTSRAYIADLVRPETRGFGMGIYMTVMDESSTMGSILGGVISDIYDFGAIFLIGAATAATCFGIVLIGVPEAGALPHYEECRSPDTPE
jgi:MFS family permease